MLDCLILNLLTGLSSSDPPLSCILPVILPTTRQLFFLVFFVWIEDRAFCMQIGRHRGNAASSQR